MVQSDHQMRFYDEQDTLIYCFEHNADETTTPELIEPFITAPVRGAVSSDAHKAL